MPQNLWQTLQELAVQTCGEPVPLLSGWGSTETAPVATDSGYEAKQSGVIGLPIPGCELKLIPEGGKLEARVRGVNVTPGYWRRPDLTASHFDAEGFYKIGDALRFIDPKGDTYVSFTQRCGHTVVTDGSGHQTWPLEALSCSAGKRKKG